MGETDLTYKKVMRRIRKIIMGIALVGGFLIATLGGVAQANVMTSAGRGALEVVEQGVKTLTKLMLREGVEETTEQAARRAVRAAAKQSPEFARLAREVGEEALVKVLNSPAARKLVEKYGDDATEILLKHGKMGGELLEYAPSAAKSIKNLSPEWLRRFSNWKDVGKLTQETATQVIQWAERHPVIAGVAGAYILSPRFRSVVGGALDVADSTLNLAASHPTTSIIIVLIVAFLLWYFKPEIKAGLAWILLWPLRWLRKKKAQDID